MTDDALPDDKQLLSLDLECCICRGSVPAGGGASPLDPCTLILISNYSEARDSQKEQQFFCHFECFRRVVNDDGILYIMESDYPTAGEPAREGWGEDE